MRLLGEPKGETVHAPRTRGHLITRLARTRQRLRGVGVAAVIGARFFERDFDGIAQSIGCEWFAQEIRGAGLHHPRGEFGRGERRHHHDARGRINFVGARDEFVAVEFGHLLVNEG